MTETITSSTKAPAGAVPQAAVVVERTYRATLEELWALWTTKDGFESWWGPEGFRVEVQVLEAHEGGALEYDMIADAPQAVAAMKAAGQPISHGTRGRFSAFRPHTHLELTHAIDFIDGVAPYDNVIEVDFYPAGDVVRMVTTIHPHLDPHWTGMAAQGYASQLTKLDRRFTR
jgi:uncharacterized protein YndB with AHSA1/START domain